MSVGSITLLASADQISVSSARKVSSHRSQDLGRSVATAASQPSSMRSRGRTRLVASSSSRKSTAAASTRGDPAHSRALSPHPVFSPTESFERPQTSSAFLGRGSNTPEVEANTLRLREPTPYEHLREKSPYIVRGMSPNYCLYNYPLH